MDKEEKLGSQPLENTNEEEFCQQYLIFLKQGPAYCAAYGKETSAASRAAASRLFKQIRIKDRIAFLMDERAVRTQRSANDVLDFINDVLDFDPVEWFDNERGSFTLDKLKDMPIEFRRLINSVKMQGDDTLSVTFVNKEKVLDILSKHHGLQIDRTHHTIEEKSIEQILRESK